MKQVLLIISSSILFALPIKAQPTFVSGEWLKIAVTETGVHRINATDLAQLKVGGKNSNNFRLFGFTQRQLPQPNNASQGELKELSIEVSDSDGQFSGSDYLLFYAEGSHQLYVENVTTFKHQTHAYSDTAYYFLLVSGSTPGKRLLPSEGSNVTTAVPITTFDDAYVLEEELVNLEKSGRQWFGQFFNNRIEFDLPVEGVVPNAEMKISSALLGTLRSNETVTVALGNTIIGTHNLQSTRYDARDVFFRYSRRGLVDNQRFIFSNPGNSTKLTYQFTNPITPPSGAYLDYFLVHLRRELKFYGEQTRVCSFESLKNVVSEFRIQNYTANQRVWEVTNPFTAKKISLKSSGGVAIFQDATQNQLKTYVLFSAENSLLPANIRPMENQQLAFSEIPNLLIISPKAFLQQARRLAEFRRINDDLTAEVVDVEHVYHEFSGGMTDPTALRNFIRKLWRQAPEKLNYVLLFGDATFDYKNKLNLADSNPQNSIPTYESRESLEPVYSHASDDYFGFLEENEGNWHEGEIRFGNLDDRTAEDHTLDLGVGRLPIRNSTHAKEVVDKLIYYDTSPQRFGSWRTQLSFLADDEDAGFDYNIHLKDADRLSDIATNAIPNFRLNKLYLGAFPQESTPNGNGSRSPRARKALDEAVERGSLIINYNGHGSEDGWTDEKVLTIEQLLRWRNLDNLPLLLTATCEFGRYDNSGVVSGAELAILNPRGGAIGLLTTTRPVYSTTNFLLNSAFFDALQNTQNAPRLGDIFKLTKNNSISGMANRNFVLLGDPAMQLALPQNSISVTAINDLPPKNQQLKALQHVKLSGKTGDEAFSGKIKILILDKASALQTLPENNSRIATFRSYQHVLFQGIAEIKSGRFETQFVVPKDIDYRLGTGQMYFYAVNADSTADISGNFREFTIGGSEENFIPDTTPPTMELSVDERNLFTAQIRDESGINISRIGIGHELLLTLNDTLQIIANEYYISSQDFRQGTLRYPFGDLPAGEYTVKLKVWDTHNNVSEEALKFRVKPNQFTLRIEAVFPNPSEGNLTVSMKQSDSGNDLDFRTQLFNTAGQLIYERNDVCYFCGSDYQIALDVSNRALQNGVYILRVQGNNQQSQQETSTSARVIFWK